ncbi:meiotically up-regulated gene 113-domain-containing protein [Rhexocercosporidium sp. MPI-PUGE-AT-0058]|nr:meiotically up-regulated gene 113-domain-containing protein [Rhexocercosporidium sp. MPI-PUGE-AT-0058]
MAPYIPHTPESLLQRSDSKNPDAHCRGLTTSGTPCRRAIGKSPQTSPSPSPRRKSSPGRLPTPDAYCWQHKNQAAAHPGASPEGIQSATIRERTSVDTLIDRLGLLEVEERKQEKRRKPVPRPEPEKPRIENAGPERPKPRPQPASNLGLFCCIGVADETKRAPRPASNKHGRRTTAPIPPKVMKASSNLHPTNHRPSIVRDPSSRTGEFLSLIPKSASPQTTAQLLAELAKPVSELDNEGYIYMFWLTPESLSAAPPSEIASNLLAPPSRPIPGQRRTSDVLSAFSITVPDSANKKTILLKIGRAQNVYRRLNQWTKQCGYNLSLIRYYPYRATTLSDTNVDELPRTPRKVPNAHRVERLIHIELNSQRVLGDGKCKACGREHREWFEVDASRNGVKAVDEVIRRWVEWGERDGGR